MRTYKIELYSHLCLDTYEPEDEMKTLSHEKSSQPRNLTNIESTKNSKFTKHLQWEKVQIKIPSTSNTFWVQFILEQWKIWRRFYARGTLTKK